MRVTETVSFNQYWSDSRFQNKRPNLHGSKKQAFGENIYHRESDSVEWDQENSHHTYSDGTTNFNNVSNDTQSDRILLSNDFVYWGGDGPKLPSEFTGSMIDIRARRGYRNKFPEPLLKSFVDWMRNIGESGYVGKPLDWQRTS